MKLNIMTLFAASWLVAMVLGHGTHDHDSSDDTSSGRSCVGHNKSLELMDIDSDYHSKYQIEQMRGDKMVHKMKRLKDHTFRKSSQEQQQVQVDTSTTSTLDTDTATEDEYIGKRRGLLSEYDQVITIPIVFHVIYSNSDENLSDDQLDSQIDVLNKDFRGTNSEIENGEAGVFQDRVGDSKIEFYKAGTERVSIASNSTICDDGSTMKKTSEGGSDGWDASIYINIWICDIDALGYAYYPCMLGGSNEYLDGVAIDSGAVGSVLDGSNFYFTSNAYDEGRTATHEIGHYLNLMHIWGDDKSCTDGDDGVDDTPKQYSANAGCPDTSTDSCYEIDDETNTDLRDNYENYMDYSDDACMFMFTEEQVIRMRSVVSSTGCRSEMFFNGGGSSDSSDDDDDSSDDDSSDDSTNDGELYCNNGCSVPEDYINDAYCDCSECEDEEDYTCDTCGSESGTCDDIVDAGDSCNVYIYCDGTNFEDSSDEYIDCCTCNDGCEVNSGWWNDGYCDCSNCEDEEDFTCDTCNNAGGLDCDYIGESCGNFMSCPGTSRAGAMETNSDSSSSSNNNNNSDGGVSNGVMTVIIIVAVVITVLLLIVIGTYMVKRGQTQKREINSLLDKEYVPPVNLNENESETGDTKVY